MVRQKKIDGLVNIKTGRLDANAMVEDGIYPFFTCSREIFRINEYAFDSKAILLAGNNASGDFNVKYYEGKFNAYQRTYVITIPDENQLDYTYLRHKLESHLKVLKNQANGANTRFLKIGMIKDIKIPLPPLAEQKRIANILDQADQLRQLNQQVLAQYDALTKSLFLDMFGDPVLNPMGWEVIKIADVVDEVKYGTSLKAGEKGKYPYLRMNNITYDGCMNYSSLKYIDVNEKEYPKYSVKEGDLLFNRTNSKELVGKTGLITDNIERIIAGYLIRVRVSDAYNPYYVWRHLNSEWAKLTLRSMCKSIVGMANINAQELQKIKILKAPIELQNKFAEKIKNIEAQKTSAKTALAASEDLFNSLLQKAFKGEL